MKLGESYMLCRPASVSIHALLVEMLAVWKEQCNNGLDVLVSLRLLESFGHRICTTG